VPIAMIFFYRFFRWLDNPPIRSLVKAFGQSALGIRAYMNPARWFVR
jgi:hypothetical protein